MGFLKKNNDVFETISYDEMDWGRDFDPDTMYKTEFKNWENWFHADRKRRKKKIYLLIQFDVDAHPAVTMKIVEEMLQLGLKANVMIFNKRIDRGKFRQDGVIEYTDYEIDDDLLRRAAANGFTVGYHTNAMERALHDPGAALDVFHQDMADLRSRFPHLSSFSPHGGVPSKDGMNNHSIPIDQKIQQDYEVRWVHNVRSPSFMGSYSDGDFANRTKDPDRLDLPAAVRTWQAGRRYRVLIHPQYYDAVARPEPAKLPTVSQTGWFNDVWSAYENTPAQRRSLWGFRRSRSSDGPFWDRLCYVRRVRKFR